jgi:hypothetical protein
MAKQDGDPGYLPQPRRTPLDGSKRVVVNVRADGEAAYPPKKRWHAPKIVDLGAYLDLDDHVKGPSEEEQ